MSFGSPLLIRAASQTGLAARAVKDLLNALLSRERAKTVARSAEAQIWTGRRVQLSWLDEGH